MGNFTSIFKKKFGKLILIKRQYRSALIFPTCKRNDRRSANENVRVVFWLTETQDF